jgi:hypothetical protein
MSIARCMKHDRSYDTDFVEFCPDCERSGLWDADVELAESMFSLPFVYETPHDDAVKLLEVQS